MTFEQVKEEARNTIGPHCKVCRSCNGIACAGKIPGPGGKNSGRGFIDSYDAVSKIKLKLQTLYKEEAIDTSVRLMGEKFDFPVFAGPIGGVKIHYSDTYNDLTYSEAILKGCKDAGVLGFTGDGADDEVFSGTIEAIKSNNGAGITTIKPWNKERIFRKIKLAEDNNVLAIAMDIDAAGLSFLAAQGIPVGPKSLEELREIIASTKLPIILKGIMTVEGARIAKEAGAQGIIVSNHGGRVLDDVQAPIHVLEEIVQAVGDDIDILVDGGFRTGEDVFKALALGAKGVLIARPFAVAVYGNGAAGVTTYCNKIKTEFRNAMLMTGCKTLKDINRNKIYLK